jgi:hypothetical protein
MKESVKTIVKTRRFWVAVSLALGYVVEKNYVAAAQAVGSLFGN